MTIINRKIILIVSVLLLAAGAGELYAAGRKISPLADSSSTVRGSGSGTDEAGAASTSLPRPSAAAARLGPGSGPEGETVFPLGDL